MAWLNTASTFERHPLVSAMGYALIHSDEPASHVPISFETPTEQMTHALLQEPKIAAAHAALTDEVVRLKQVVADQSATLREESGCV